MSVRTKRLTALRAIYAEIPAIECKGRCVSACGPIRMTGVEWDEIVARFGRDPGMAEPPRFVCPLLTDAGRCSVYDLRPVVCRLYGVTENMRCRWGCQPERVLTKAEAVELVLRAERVAGGRMAGPGDALMQRFR